MTRDNDFKRLVRDRMSATGERYTVARTALLREREEDPMVPVTVEVRIERRAELAQGEPLSVDVREVRSGEMMPLQSPTAAAPGEGQPWLVLKEIGGRRWVPIAIGPVEATSIAYAQHGIHVDRPMTHDLLRDVVSALGESREVRITELREGTFFAELVVIDSSGAERTVPCRPSDGIALAVRAQIPILVHESLLLPPRGPSEAG